MFPRKIKQKRKEENLWIWSTIKVDKETKKVIEKFIRFCYNQNIVEAKDIGMLAEAIDGDYLEIGISHETFNIVYD